MEASLCDKLASVGLADTPKHSNLYVAHLPASIDSEAALRELFKQYGHIESCRLVRGGRRPSNAADVLASALSGASSGELIAVVEQAPPPPAAAAAAAPAPAALGQVGQEEQPAAAAHPLPPPLPPARASFAFVKYSSIAEAVAAIAALNNATVGGSVLEVKVADADAGDRNPELLAPPSDNLYAKNLPPSLSDDELQQLFSPYGTVVEHRMLRSGGSGSGVAGLLGLGAHAAAAASAAGPPLLQGRPALAGALVRMGSVEEAAAAIAHLHNQRLQGSGLPLVVRYADSQEQKARKAARQRQQLERLGSSSNSSSGVGTAPPTPPLAGSQQQGAAGGPRVSSSGSGHDALPVQYAGSAGSAGGSSGSSRGPPSGAFAGVYSGYGSNTVVAAAAAAAAAGAVGPIAPADGGPGTCSIYVKHLPESTDKLWLYEKFAPFGPVLSVKVLTTDDGKACKGAGFVNYADPESVARAVAAMCGMPVGGERRLYVAPQAHRTSR